MRKTIARRGIAPGIAVLAVTLALPASAQTCVEEVTEHFGSSPFFQAADDHRIVCDQSPGQLDTGCRFDDSGDIVVNVPIKRYFGRTDSSGQIDEALIENRFVSEKAYLVMPAFDIDLPDEVDHVYLNGEFQRQLEGTNGSWALNIIPIDVRDLKFPSDPGSPWGSPPQTVTNEVRIVIDVNSDRRWCMSLDWVAIYVDGIYPLLLFHGIGAAQDAWENADIAARDHLQDLGVPFRSDINLPNTFGTRDNNSEDIAEIINATLPSFGVQRFHIVGHSKGGLDSRHYLAQRLRTQEFNPRGYWPRSYVTMATPHHGSVLADMAWPAWAFEVEGRSENGIAQRYLDSAWTAFENDAGPRPPGLHHLRPGSLQQFNTQNLVPTQTRFGSMISDAQTTVADDPEANHIEEPEAMPLLAEAQFPGATGRVRAVAGTRLYRALGFITQVRMTGLETGFFNNVTAYNIEVTARGDWNDPNPIQNDLAVTQPSSQLGTGHPEIRFVRNDNDNVTEEADALNHAAIKDDINFDVLLNWIKQWYPRDQMDVPDPKIAPGSGGNDD